MKGPNSNSVIVSGCIQRPFSVLLIVSDNHAPSLSGLRLRNGSHVTRDFNAANEI